MTVVSADETQTRPLWSRQAARPRLVPACQNICTGHVLHQYKIPIPRPELTRVDLMKCNCNSFIVL